MNHILVDLRSDLLNNADQKTKISGERFFREEVKMYGIRSALVISIGKEHYARLADKTRSNVYALCEELFKSGMMEESFVACNWSYYARKQFESSDFLVFEKWVKSYVNNWATCDTLCNHTVGTLIEMFPGLISDLKKWTNSSNRWVKRASAVSLILPARKGLFLKDIFEIAGLLLTDGDDMVQKGYGWMLKAASQAHQQEVFRFVMDNKAVMPRTSLRYAIEKMPSDLKKEAMKK